MTLVILLCGIVFCLAAWRIVKEERREREFWERRANEWHEAFRQAAREDLEGSGAFRRPVEETP